MHFSTKSIKSFQPVEKLHELLPECEKVPRPYQHLQVTEWIASIDGQEEHDSFNRSLIKKFHYHPNRCQTSSSSNVRKQPQTWNKAKGKAPTTKPYSQGCRMQM
ncbi:hypothetical protein O181_128722 [Austropuccinia psidii MF-1]|uniref:Uncharacterized protein n=1 Tax=Austropuccinia psidii MF-1 TaxID=1389203 RepID=A0A9Q3L0F0_9BASI|nr:hypothetical protein [Austropuccinia psidii MF-1]